MNRVCSARRLSSSKAWMNRHVNDIYVKKSISEDLRSRSAFKLMELQEKHKLIRKNDVVIDLGAAPGGWSIVAGKTIDTNAGGMIVGVDLLPIDPVPNVTFLQGDFTLQKTQDELVQLLSGRHINVVLSDMLSNTCGHQQTDHFRSMNLATAALEFSRKHLIAGKGKAVFLCKYLRGSDEKELISLAQSVFASVKTVKPKASRSESAEVYLLCRDMKA